jgi:hypothetical protein
MTAVDDPAKSLLPSPQSRSAWLRLSDPQLLGQCEVDTYRASGPGGQKRNKTSSAVRLRHLPSGLIVIAEESRSQHENKLKALKRLRRALSLEVREPISLDSPGIADAIPQRPEIAAILDSNRRLQCSPRNERFWPAAAFLLDLLHATEARVSTVASLLGVSTANLVEFFRCDPKLWQTVNQIRTHFGEKPLK